MADWFLGSPASLQAEMWPDPRWSFAGDMRAPYPLVDRPQPQCSELAGDTCHATVTCVVAIVQPNV